MKRLYFLFIIGILLICLYPGCNLASDLTIKSPDGTISVTLSNEADDLLRYRIICDGEEVIAFSSLGHREEHGIIIPTGYRLLSKDITELDSVWMQPWGANKNIRENYRELAAHFGNIQHSNIKLTIRFRVFDDGVGFRYEYDCKDTDKAFLRITDELTEFRFNPKSITWSTMANPDTYELPYRTQTIEELESANTPITIKLPSGLFVSIHEANLDDYPEMMLKKEVAGTLKANLVPWPDGIKAIVPHKFKTPWRTIQIGRKAVDLINSHLILNLNEPCAIDDSDWIRPVKYVGIWWAMHLGIASWIPDERHGATTERALTYIDFAKRNNIDAVLFEGWNEGWEDWGGRQGFNQVKAAPDFDLKKVIAHCEKSNIAFIMHNETGGNIPEYEACLDSAFAYYRQLGVHHVKTGYAGGIPGGYFHHSQYAVRHYRQVIKKAAAYQLCVNAHEPIKDTGLRRTYPNAMTREGARGMEWNAWSEGNTPTHTVILPFTRLLAGPMDYTPGIFDILFEKTKDLPSRKKWNDLDKGNSRVHTTLARQIANWVIFYSPMQMASDLVEHYEHHPAFQFFKDYSADIDESSALQGYPGEFIVQMRRAGTFYFLGAATNETARSITLPLSFLEPDRIYRMTLYKDAPDADYEFNPMAYEIEQREVDRKDTLDLSLARGGGVAMILKPIAE